MDIFCFAILILLLLGIAGLLWNMDDDDKEIVIGHIPSTTTAGKCIDPQKCPHNFYSSRPVYEDRGKPNRHHGIKCYYCKAMLWENGDITITRA